MAQKNLNQLLKEGQDPEHLISKLKVSEWLSWKGRCRK
jgi:hypothetical protein